VNSYISYLLDHHSKIGKTIEINCKSEILAEKVANHLSITQSAAKVKGKFHEIFDQVVPIDKYAEYHSVYFDEMRLITLCPEKDDEYIAAAFDLDGHFKYNKKDEKTYPIIAFKKKEIYNDLMNFMKKSWKSEVTIQGKDLLFTLERLKDHMIVRREHVDKFIDCLMEPDNPYFGEKLEEYTKNLKNK